MRLERLEIAGFKSFSDRAEVSFDRGVTAIVGPNGCGKSNLADALTWVLGEQSAKSLRGEKMEDVIFNGSDARKPTGTAEVRLRLSDVPVPPSMVPEGEGEPDPAPDETPQDAPLVDMGANGNGHDPGHVVNGNGHRVDLLGAVRDVEVTRRLYRSGESEYLIDGHVCRLRDIHELLMDTGLGAKAYSIIEQGKIGMILSSRPTDRRQLIEEAAGITKYKARRRAAELKLEAAQQNLTRVDDIVFEVEKQRGSLKRQAAKARRYARLRDEMRRWEKVLFARRYRALGEAIESARARLVDARTEEAAASGRLAAVETELAALRISLAEAEAAATRVREAAHARELEIRRRQQQIALDTQQAEMLQQRATELEAELRQLEARREPDRLAIEERRAAVSEAERARDEAASAAAAAAEETATAQREIETAEQDVESVRSDLFALMNTMTALRTGIESARAQRERAAEGLARLDIEAADLRTEHDRASSSRRAAEAALEGFRASLESTRAAQIAREAELATARAEHESRSRELRSREQELTACTARLRSLEELDAARAGFSDAARMVLAQANGKVGQLGAVADFLDVEPRYERVVEACLGDLLQHVLVDHHDHASAGLDLVRQEDAGRCGFVIVGANPGTAPRTEGRDENVARTDATPLSSVIRFSGPHADELRAAVGEALIADSFESAARLSTEVAVPIATMDGDVFRGPQIIVGGGKADGRGILATKREIKELRDRIEVERVEVTRLADETATIEQAITLAVSAVATLSAELHRHEKEIVGAEAQLARANADETRLEQRTALVAQETRRAQEEMQALDARHAEASESIAKLDEEKRAKEDTFAERQRVLAERRETAERLSQKAAEARAAHAGLIERASSSAAEVVRLEEAVRELERRVESSARDARLMHEQRERLIAAAAESQTLMDADVSALETLRVEMREADDHAQTLKESTERQEVIIRDARRAVDAVRALAAELDVTRATAESDLGHLAQQCMDAVAATLDEVNLEVEQMEAAGAVEPDIRAIRAAEAPEPDDEEAFEASAGEPAEPAQPEPGVIDGRGGSSAFADASADRSDPPAEAEPVHMTAEEAITELKGKIDRLGPVNMMAIEQFDELEQRHTFLTTQRKDLVDSIAQTNEAIRRIDETTHARFREAFTAIAANFQLTFSTLFGGGRAGLTLLDENDPLESGIDIVASPPGKRLQNVQLLSGGEKALTAIALMFAIFRYKPSPFCLLDEIDAPLDDANIGRFVEMLRGMLARTQFIIITHNRKTMEIANRLYGVTMEEPGVSKLISMQLN